MRPGDVPCDGIVLIDKPEGPTSAGVVAAVKKKLAAKKVGHTGTLDPFATGLLICCVNRATRLARFFLHGNKRYGAVLRLGIETDTMDKTGRPMSRPCPVTVSETDIYRVCERFVGEIEQQPPVYSALKHNGVPLYRLARKGRPVEKPPRRVRIFSLEIRRIALPDIEFEVACSSGTYIRTLGADIGRALGCGGHLTGLRRLESNGFSVTEAIELGVFENLADAGRAWDRIVDMPSALRGMPAVRAGDALAEKIRFGRPILKRDLAAAGTPQCIPDRPVKVVDRDNRLVAVIQYDTNKQRYDYCCTFQFNHSN